MAKELIIRQWRMESVADGCWLFFDPVRETVRLFEAEPLEIEGVADALEGDDQRGLFDSEESSKNELVEDELPF